MDGPTKFKFTVPLTDRRKRIQFVTDTLGDFQKTSCQHLSVKIETMRPSRPQDGDVMKIPVPLLFMLFAMPALAERQFDIEVVIFKRAIDAKKTNESWPQNLPSIEFKNSGSLNDSNYRARKGVIMLPASEYKLNDQVTKLSQHAGFKVLMHKAWRQGDKGRYVPLIPYKSR